MKLTFLGATDSVTGSRFLVQAGKTRVLIDCGMYQGLKRLRERNWDRFPVEPSSIDAVLLTHAHIDHSGYLPVLVRRGFEGPVHCTEGTARLCRLLLPDAGYLAEEDARHRNRHKTTRHHPALPLFTRADAVGSLVHLRDHNFDETFRVGEIEVRFRRAGHILGASSIYLYHRGKTLVFSGDVGRSVDPIMPPPAPLVDADWLVVESTYGDRKHRDADPRVEITAIANRTLKRGGTLLIPSFAVGRTQSVLHLLAESLAAGELMDVPVYVNSPMAIHATEIFFQQMDEHKLDTAACQRMADLVRYSPTVEDSMALVDDHRPKIVLSASGMCSGGRILHHLMSLAPNERNTVLLVGFQASGTRGEALANGADELKIHGRYVEVNADVKQIHSLSAHGDYTEILDWLRPASPAPKRTFVVHGRPSAQDAMRRRIADHLGWEAEVPKMGQEVVLK